MLFEMQQRLQETASDMIETASDKFLEYVPQIVLGFIVFIVGAVVAHIVRKIVLRLADFIGLDKLAAKVNVDQVLRTVGIRRSISKILGFLVYWLIVLFALLLMSEVLDLGTISDAIGAIVVYIPNLIAGLLILVIGLLVGRFFRDVVSTSLARAGITASNALGYIIQSIIIIFVCLLALKQVGFDISVITTNISVILGIVLVSIGFAITLAIRPVLESYFICRELRGQLRKGDTIEFEGVNGKVIGFSLTCIIIRQTRTDIIIPARQLFEQRFTRKRAN